jgi:hypothetical protein
MALRKDLGKVGTMADRLIVGKIARRNALGSSLSKPMRRITGESRIQHLEGIEMHFSLCSMRQTTMLYNLARKYSWRVFINNVAAFMLFWCFLRLDRSPSSLSAEDY